MESLYASARSRRTKRKGETDIRGGQPVSGSGAGGGGNGIAQGISFGGKIRRLPVDRGSEAGSFDGTPSSQVSSNSDFDVNHPLHNGADDMVVVSMATEHNGIASGISKFPKLDELKHFHYNSVNLRTLKVFLDPADTDSVTCVGADSSHIHIMFKVEVYSNGSWWFVYRGYDDFCALDQLCHRCIYNRTDTQLAALRPDTVDSLQAVEEKRLQLTLSQYLHHLLEIGMGRINCASILEWFEVSKEGNRRHASYRSGINVRGKAAARVIRPFQSSQPDELPLAVGTIVSIIDMPPPGVSQWWRGKKGLKVGFFPQECVELIEKGTSPAQHQKGRRPSLTEKHVTKTNPKPSLPSHVSSSRDSLARPDRLFGGDLGAHVYQTNLSGDPAPQSYVNEGGVPLVVRDCTAFVEKHGVVVGIYRLNGINSNIHSLKEGYEQASLYGTPELERDNILADQHCVSSLCKLYFRELPNPLLTYDLFDDFCIAVTHPDPDACYMALARCLAKLPPPHLRCTEHLMRHLNRLARQSSETEMHARNLSIVWAPNLLQIRDDGSSPVNLMLIRRTAQVIEWLIERVDWFFGEDGLDAMKGPEPDPCTIPTRPAIPAPEPESDDSCTQSQENLSIATIPGHVQKSGNALTSSQSACNLSMASSEDRHQVRRSMSDCSHISSSSMQEPSPRTTVVTNPRKAKPRASTLTTPKLEHHRDPSRRSGRFRSFMHLPFRKQKKVAVDISLPTDIVTTVDVRLHVRINKASPVEASGLITPRETSRMLHSGPSAAASSPGAASGYGTLPYSIDETGTNEELETNLSMAAEASAAASGDTGNDDVAQDLEKYAHGDTSSDESESETGPSSSVSTTGVSAAVATPSEDSSIPDTSAAVLRRRSSVVSPPGGSSTPTTPTRSLNLQRLGSDVVALGHPGMNVRYSQHILHWSFEDGEAKAYHLSGAPADAAPDSAASLASSRRRAHGSTSCMEPGSSTSFPFSSRQSSGSMVLRRRPPTADSGTLPASTSVPDTQRHQINQDDNAVDGAAASAEGVIPKSDSGDMLACVLAAGDSYVSPAHGSHGSQAPESLTMPASSDVPLHSSTPLPVDDNGEPGSKMTLDREPNDSEADDKHHSSSCASTMLPLEATSAEVFPNAESTVTSHLEMTSVSAPAAPREDVTVEMPASDSLAVEGSAEAPATPADDGSVLNVKANSDSTVEDLISSATEHTDTVDNVVDQHVAEGVEPSASVAETPEAVTARPSQVSVTEGVAVGEVTSSDTLQGVATGGGDQGEADAAPLLVLVEDSPDSSGLLEGVTVPEGHASTATDGTRCSLLLDDTDTAVEVTDGQDLMGFRTPSPLPVQSPLSDLPLSSPLSDLPLSSPLSDLPLSSPLSDLPLSSPLSDLPLSSPSSGLPLSSPPSDLPLSSPPCDLPLSPPSDLPPCPPSPVPSSPLSDLPPPSPSIAGDCTQEAVLLPSPSLDAPCDGSSHSEQEQEQEDNVSNGSDEPAAFVQPSALLDLANSSSDTLSSAGESVSSRSSSVLDEHVAGRDVAVTADSDQEPLLAASSQPSDSAALEQVAEVASDQLQSGVDELASVSEGHDSPSLQ
ncbi:rho GTPase-activating protein 32-like isoform X3 [Sycon ciliatum]|uniref:rho GTPase-activating protein 32-like isoform X3 n=1 Tax=Sycon ciliatum TaxID=27933 RepID=UPI0031F6BFFB